MTDNNDKQKNSPARKCTECHGNRKKFRQTTVGTTLAEMCPRCNGTGLEPRDSHTPNAGETTQKTWDLHVPVCFPCATAPTLGTSCPHGPCCYERVRDRICTGTPSCNYRTAGVLCNDCTRNDGMKCTRPKGTYCSPTCPIERFLKHRDSPAPKTPVVLASTGNSPDVQTVAGEQVPGSTRLDGAGNAGATEKKHKSRKMDETCYTNECPYYFSAGRDKICNVDARWCPKILNNEIARLTVECQQMNQKIHWVRRHLTKTMENAIIDARARKVLSIILDEIGGEWIEPEE